VLRSRPGVKWEPESKAERDVRLSTEMISRVTSGVAIIGLMLSILLLGRDVLGIGRIGTLGLALVVGTVIGVVEIRLQMRKQGRR